MKKQYHSFERLKRRKTLELRATIEEPPKRRMKAETTVNRHLKLKHFLSISWTVKEYCIYKKQNILKEKNTIDLRELVFAFASSSKTQSKSNERKQKVIKLIREGYGFDWMFVAVQINSTVRNWVSGVCVWWSSEASLSLRLRESSLLLFESCGVLGFKSFIYIRSQCADIELVFHY